MCKLGLLDNTLIIRMADHGEMGLSHGLREKMYTAYEEAIHVPLIYSNPKLWPSPQIQRRDGLVARSPPDARGDHRIDEHVDAPRHELSRHPPGNEDGRAGQRHLHVDDQFDLPPTTTVGHIRCIRTKTMKYSVYFDVSGSTFEYEMYDLASDPGECT